jgi:hypothetical protein
MASVQIGLPAAILLMAFLLKLFIDRTASNPDIIQALLELPVDVTFLAISLIAGFTISTPSRIQDGLLHFVIYLAGAILIVVLWRRSIRYFDSKRIFPTTIISILNFFLCIYGLLKAINLLTEAL